METEVPTVRRQGAGSWWIPLVSGVAFGIRHAGPAPGRGHNHLTAVDVVSTG
jgi:hypothetical protein